MSDDPELAVKLADAGNVTTILEFAGLALLVWDWLLTLDTEIRHVWPARWSLGKILFLLTRYLPLSDVLISIAGLQLPYPSDDWKACQIPYTVIVWLDVFGILVAHMILVLRTWAIYDRSKWALYCLVGFLLAEGIYGGVAVIIFVNSIVWAGPEMAYVRGCNVVSVDSRLVSGSYLGVMFFESTVFIATMVKALERRRHSSSPLIKVVFRDGLIFYLLIVCISITNVTVLFAASEEYTVCLVIFQRIMHSIATGRILLHMRESTMRSNLHLGSAVVNHEETWDMQTFATNTIQFANPQPTATITQQIETRLGVDEWFVDENKNG